MQQMSIVGVEHVRDAHGTRPTGSNRSSLRFAENSTPFGRVNVLLRMPFCPVWSRSALPLLRDWHWQGGTMRGLYPQIPEIASLFLCFIGNRTGVGTAAAKLVSETFSDASICRR